MVLESVLGKYLKYWCSSIIKMSIYTMSKFTFTAIQTNKYGSVDPLTIGTLVTMYLKNQDMLK